MTDHHYEIVALSIPVVYNGDGDHDRNGMLYTLRAYYPLLRWARDRWEDGDEYLPRLHRKRQLMQLVVDGLRRYESMREKLSGHHQSRLLMEYGGDEEIDRRPELDRRLDAYLNAGGPDAVTAQAHALAIRQNFRDTVDEIVTSLTELTGGRVTRLHRDPAIRAEWLASWSAALADARQGVEDWLRTIDEHGDSPNCFDAEALAALTDTDGQQLSADQVRRLLLNDHTPEARRAGSPRYDRFNPLKPIPLARPLVLRACQGDSVTVRLENQLGRTGARDLLGPRRAGLHLQAAGLGSPEGDGVVHGDGADVGRNPDTTVEPRGRRTFRWLCPHEGTWLINDLADTDGSERGSNAHGLFGALIVEPPGSTWRDPETGQMLTGTPWADGLDVDIMVADEQPGTDEHLDFVDFHRDDVPRSHREFTVFLHDEPDIHSPWHQEHVEHAVMPFNYRAEPMVNRVPYRLRRLVEATPAQPEPGQSGVDVTAVASELNEELTEEFWIGRRPDGEYLERVAGEEQHHSSWLFGEPAVPVNRSYRGDPARVRLLHPGVKETHVYHLHVHQWRAAAADTARPSEWRGNAERGSQLLDSITIGPQTTFTIDPLYGSGSRQKSTGDIIWHCHLYPHFHHGMWGLWRNFDCLVDGSVPYPDGTPAAALVPLPGREPPKPSEQRQGFPWFVPGPYPQKSPPPPAIRDEDVVARRRLLGMEKSTALERAAFDPGCVADPRPGALFVDLDGMARRWNDDVGLPAPRVIRYDVETTTQPIEYNSEGWHDRTGHVYRLTGVEVTTPGENGRPASSERFEVPDDAEARPFYPRANHGDIIEWRMRNGLTSYAADHFDLGVPPVECALHVHLVKFDVLAADGSATGWNYLSGASAAEMIPDDLPGPGLPSDVGVHRWVVDEEFGTVFLHDHLLANFRQKRGLSAALIAEPHGSRWLDVRQEAIAWNSVEAVIEPPRDSGLPPYREACLSIGDFVPLYDRRNRPLNAPNRLGGVSDPGVMGVNYRNAPLRHRGDDPSLWFSSTATTTANGDEAGRGDPDPGLILQTYPGERLRLRLVQGSHEEQHSFVLHGLRWRRDWHAEGENLDGWRRGAAPLVNQQTLGISEAFTLDIDPQRHSPYGPGDYLWSFTAVDDLWLGCWGLLRAHLPSAQQLAALPPLPHPTLAPEQAVEQIRQARPPDAPRRRRGGWSAPVREYIVRARRIEHAYSDTVTDPWGLIYEVADGWEPVHDAEGRDTGHRRATGVRRSTEPLVLRARRGEWVRVTLINEVLSAGRDAAGDVEADTPGVPFGVENNPPRVPVEHRDETGAPDRRTVTPRVSLHPSVLLYDVVDHDGANVGHNHDGTVAAWDPDGDDHGGHVGHGLDGVVFRDHHVGHQDPNWRDYWWYADQALAPASSADGPGQVCYLYDMADIRNHRHHGLVGALVVLPDDLTPLEARTGRERWTGISTTLRTGRRRRGGASALLRTGRTRRLQEHVVFLQDGLRHFVAGNPQLPVPDSEPGIDPVDAGQKGINYRSAVTGRRMLRPENPPTPVFTGRLGDEVWLRVVGAADKPRNHTFTVHGHAWRATPWLGAVSAWSGALSGISGASTHDLVLRADEAGDHAYRTGVFRWHLGEGMWGILRIVGRGR